MRYKTKWTNKISRLEHIKIDYRAPQRRDTVTAVNRDAYDLLREAYEARQIPIERFIDRAFLLGRYWGNLAKFHAEH